MSANDRFNPQLDSELLRSFLAVAKAGSVSGGASRLFRTQSAISLQVRKLEETVGQQLFERHGRGVSLTARGEQLLSIARQVVETLDQAVIAMRQVKARSEIRLGIPEEYGDTLLPLILTEFAKEHPGARILLWCSSSAGFRAAIERGDLDIALHSPADVTSEDAVVHQEAAVWAGSAYHEVETRKPLQVALFDKACWWRQRCLDLLDASGLDYEIVCTSESVAGVRAAISAGIAVGVLPRSSLTESIRLLTNPELPHLGETPLVLTRASGARAELADSLTNIVKKTLGALSV
ncbi:LysR family transcriptional regulator [Phyllobacterium sp. K27]